MPPGDRPDAVVPNVKVSSSNDLQAQGVGTVAMPVRRSRAGETPSTIEARGLTKRYGDKLAVDDLSFEVKPGHVTGFLGPNGAGKSTTMRLIMGLDAPNSGSVTVNGRHYHDLGWPLSRGWCPPRGQGDPSRS